LQYYTFKINFISVTIRWNKITSEGLGPGEALEFEGRGEERGGGSASLLRLVDGVHPLGATFPHDQAHPQGDVGRCQVHEAKASGQSKSLNNNLQDFLKWISVSFIESQKQFIFLAYFL
jgi:hypothetical protein